MNFHLWAHKKLFARLKNRLVLVTNEEASEMFHSNCLVNAAFSECNRNEVDSVILAQKVVDFRRTFNQVGQIVIKSHFPNQNYYYTFENRTAKQKVTSV